jgi:SAM-dependent methyltransferase
MKSEDGFFHAAIESAHIFNHAVREVAFSSGLMSALNTYRSIDDIVRVMDFRTERAEQVGHLLRILESEGYTESREHSGLTVFKAVPADTQTAVSLAGDNSRYQPKYDLVDSWFGEGHSEKIRESNKKLLGADLSFMRSQQSAIRFNNEYADSWRINLNNPLYDFGRLLCVRELTTRGNRFLDLASGPGFGAQRLAEFSDGQCEIVCVDKSTDFLAMARSNTYPSAKVTFIEQDLNQGLPPLAAGSFDGILFNGAFHFMADKASRLREMWRALRPGGALALGHCFSHSGFGDETMHDFYFSLISDRAYVLPWSSVKELVEEVGFNIFREFHRGSHSYLIAERPLTVAEAPALTALDSLRPQLRGGIS